MFSFPSHDHCGEYVVPTSTTCTVPVADQHSTSVSIRNLAANTNANSHTTNWNTRTFSWDPPAGAKFASILIYKYDISSDLQVDWVTGFPDTRGLLAADFTKTDAIQSLGDAIFPATLRNSAVDAAHVGLGSVANKSPSDLAADSNLTNVFANSRLSISLSAGGAISVDSAVRS